ncbi:ribonuclease P protein component [Mesoplasma photuris]|uniref:ribonuclease P protein component n=1 Tax=Mesoplasma photuris TaxID=217731 RepID=UPI0004E27C1E|nr:ribonuclease P protein component [Mesoplasma photuris]
MKNKRIIKDNFKFQSIISKQKVLKNPSFIIYFEKSEIGFLQYGISVGKKLGNAVFRNKIKRQVRMMMNEVIKTEGDKSYKIIVMARKAMTNKDFETNQNALKNVVSNLK